MTPLLRNSLVEYCLSHSADCHSDHEPIRTVISLSTILPNPQQRRNWNKVNISMLQARLAANFQASGILNQPTNYPNNPTKAGIDRQIDNLIEAIQDAIELSTPFINISPYMRPGFTAEYKKAQKIAKKLKKRWKKLGTVESWEAFWEARNCKGRIIKKTMRKQC